MKRIFLSLWLSSLLHILPAQGFADLHFGTDTTLEVLSWNIEHFPKNGAVTIDYVSQIINALDVDLLAIQEVGDTLQFNQLVEGLAGYKGYVTTSYFAGYGLAYMYKTSTIEVKDFYEIYTTSPYWSPFPRSPMVMELRYKGVDVVLINNHFKCCGDEYLDLNNPADEETRRFRASNLLKEFIDTNFANERVIVLGDLNDALTDTPSNNVFQSFIDDPDNYLFADMEIALGSPSDWSYPTWPSHLDHILLTNELFNAYENTPSGVTVIKIEDVLEEGWSEYDANISDHRPLGLKMKFDVNSGIAAAYPATGKFTNFPNPVHESTTLFFGEVPRHTQLDIYNLAGQLQWSSNIPQGRSSFNWKVEGLPTGMYMAILHADQKLLGSLKMAVVK